jgi:CheY-like chemotaxis protein
MDGEITFEKRTPRGTTFRVTLPASAARGEEAVAEPAARPVDRLRLLLVDDEPAICRSLEILWRDDHDVVSATRATEALARVTAGESFDVILCDLMMAEMNGMQLYEALCELSPRIARRVLFLTGGAFTPASQEFLERVPNLRVDKPFDIKVLDEAMRTTRRLADAADAAEA